MEGGAAETPPHVMRPAAIALQHLRMVTARSRAQGGLRNLIQTYRDDPTLSSQAQLLVEEIDAFRRLTERQSDSVRCADRSRRLGAAAAPERRPLPAAAAGEAVAWTEAARAPRAEAPRAPLRDEAPRRDVLREGHAGRRSPRGSTSPRGKTAGPASDALRWRRRCGERRWPRAAAHFGCHRARGASVCRRGTGRCAARGRCRTSARGAWPSSTRGSATTIWNRATIAASPNFTPTAIWGPCASTRWRASSSSPTCCTSARFTAISSRTSCDTPPTASTGITRACRGRARGRSCDRPRPAALRARARRRGGGGGRRALTRVAGAGAAALPHAALRERRVAEPGHERRAAPRGRPRAPHTASHGDRLDLRKHFLK